VRHFIDKPTIAAVNGAALGGGTELALASDMVVAGESAVFGLPEVKIGVLAAGGGAFRLVETLPPKIGLRLLLTGEPITAADAARWGMINEVVPDGTALDAALKLAEQIVRNAPMAVAASKRVAYRTAGGPVPGDESGWDAVKREVRQLGNSEDAKEGPLVFAEKRLPRWKGR